MSEDFRDYIVTEDPELLTKLRAKMSELGSHGLPTFAYSLGLFPPGYEEGQQHSISGYAPPGHEGETYLVWDVGLESPGVDDQDYEEYEDDENPWAALGVEVVDTHQSDGDTTNDR